MVLPVFRGVRRLHSVRGRACAVLIGVALTVTGLTSGCNNSKYVQFRRVPRNPLAAPLQLLSYSGPEATPRTIQLLRRYDLETLYRSDTDAALSRLSKEIQREPTAEKVFAYAEIAYVRAKRADVMGNKEVALNHYGAAVAYAYQYLFDRRFAHTRNSYDPQFRGACDLYNAGLEGALRIANGAGLLKPGSTQEIRAGDEEYTVSIQVRGPWHVSDFDRLEFVTDYEVQGLNNRHHTFGLGVPLIAVRKPHLDESPAEQFYPPGLSFPVTAFLRVSSPRPGEPRVCALELHDPMASNTVQIAGRTVPLETDLSTSLAFFLDHPQLRQSATVATAGLLNPSFAQPLSGLYMLEPYDPKRIPVIMVHGLWSSPLTWMEMFNDLQAFPEVRDNFQFWFYLYPTGQPFWVSAAQLREDLARARSVLDPHHRTPPLDQIVLVGHSMGGLVSRMQTIESGNDFWQLVSDKPFSAVEADDETKHQLARTLFFHPNNSIKRLITIATPHRGSEFANKYTRWLGRKLITLPNMLVQANQAIIGKNPQVFRNADLLTITTSIDSLAPDSPLLPALLQAQPAPWVQHHNIVGVAPEEEWVGSLTKESDGLVKFESAHLEGIASELVVPASHTNVHRHPRTILEVRRILLDHLQQTRLPVAQQPVRLRVRHAGGPSGPLGQGPTGPPAVGPPPASRGMQGRPAAGMPATPTRPPHSGGGRSVPSPQDLEHATATPWSLSPSGAAGTPNSEPARVRITSGLSPGGAAGPAPPISPDRANPTDRAPAVQRARTPAGPEPAPTDRRTDNQLSPTVDRRAINPPAPENDPAPSSGAAP